MNLKSNHYSTSMTGTQQLTPGANQNFLNLESKYKMQLSLEKINDL